MKDRSAFVRATLTLLALATMTACGGGGDPDEVERLQQNQQRWQSLGLTSYVYRFQRSCFCPPQDTREVTITVSNDQITAVRYVDNGQAVPADRFDHYLTVDGLFELAAAALARPADSYEATFDASLGYPLRVAIDYESGAADDEVTIVTRDLH